MQRAAIYGNKTSHILANQRKNLPILFEIEENNITRRGKKILLVQGQGGNTKYRRDRKGSTILPSNIPKAKFNPFVLSGKFR